MYVRDPWGCEYICDLLSIGRILSWTAGNVAIERSIRFHRESLTAVMVLVEE
jgi:hypothetical protein